MARYLIEIEEVTVYQEWIEATSAAEAQEIANSKLVESDGPESAFGSPVYGDTFVRDNPAQYIKD